MKGVARDGGAVPESVMDAVNQTLTNVEEVQSHLHEFFVSSDPEVLSQMPTLQRAQSLFLLAKITSTLYTLKLRCSGVHPDDHPVKSDLRDLNRRKNNVHGQTKLVPRQTKSNEDLSKEPLRPSTTLNYQAATRFIEHSLPDLTPEQRQNMRSLSRGERPKMNNQERSGQKRKYQSSEKQSVQAAAKEFLEKAAREILGNNASGIKGPIPIDISDEDDQ
ncbi:uncharacterized protein LOC129302119 [Prosopis cineraria]|uniref:uncharacterized protein LOC129302119 n=1 Tax=Prosopis cineraria TaxID=364024 RepID=UPI00240F62C4|nr:uncharacterized protein LOC129302119 [Prosopis cineraria]